MTTVAAAIVILSLVAVIGRLLGEIRFKGICMGSAGVLFAGILFGHFGAHVDENIAEFAKEFGLVLFVFTIGLQLGPGIIQLWKQQGLILNAMAVAIVTMGVGLVLLIGSMLDYSVFASAGIFSGATTNTPSLGAAQQAAVTIQSESGDGISTLASAYAVVYPGGIIGIIASMLLLKHFLRVDVKEAKQELRNANESKHEPILRRTIQVENANLAGIRFGEIPGVEETGIRISRIKRASESSVHSANVESVVQQGDLIQVVGTKNGLDRFGPLIGTPSTINLMKSAGDADYRRVVVTETDVLNKSLSELSLDKFYNTTVTRIRRNEIEMTASGRTRLHYGDILHIVGDAESLDRATKMLGNSVRSMNETPFTPLFLGIAVGVFIGMLPVSIPGIPLPVKLGLAGGPLIAAIAFSLIGSVGKLVWYMPYAANLAIREFGITLFLACTGLKAGQTFFSIALTGQGLAWILTGIAVTMIPLLITGYVASKFFKLNYLTVCGVIAGSMTDPPALAFANSVTDSEACSTAYAAVYPLTMILRIIAAQTIVYLLA